MMKRISIQISRIVLITVLLFCSTPVVKSQTDTYALTPEKLLPQFSAMTPEAASLGKYGAYNVSEYSGSPNVKIPLFTISSGDVSIPVELYYDASGIKVNQDATFVGLGWNLSYGGMISHIVCGEDDFKESTQTFPGYFKKYFGDKPIPNDRPCQYFIQYSDKMSFVGYRERDEMALCDPVPDSKPFYLHYDMSRGCFTPDIFQVSFCGHHLSFIIDKRDESKIVIISDDGRKYKVEYETDDIYPRYPSVFRIIDDKGITYQFQAFQEYSNKDTYYLTQVYGADGISGKSSIKFEYETHYYKPGKSRPDLKTINSKGKYLGGDYPNDSALTYQMSSLLGDQNHYTSLSGEREGCDKVYPHRITTALETIEFDLQDREDHIGGKAISKITVKSKDDEILHQVNLTYDYFHEQSSSSFYTNKRLKLTTVSINSKKYQLSYETSPLPTFMSTSQDYWGYYNGENNGNNLCGTPKFILDGNSVVTVDHLGEANRYASEELCKVGMLKRITYPTGGYTDFEYEVNRFNDKYYYPDADRSYISSPTMVHDFNVYINGVSGPRYEVRNFSLQKEKKYKLQIGLYAQANDSSYVLLRNSTTGAIIKEVHVTNGEQFGESFNLMLSPGQYTIEAKISVHNTGHLTVANCTLSHEAEITIPQSEMTTGQNNGGISIGGGLRIKSIKNYDSSSRENKYLNGVEYEYQDGKLLIPTLRLEKHYINFSYFSNDGYGSELYPNFTFAYANSEPSYMYICSVGVPATVGYSKVIKKDVDEYGQAIKRTELEFHNNGYEMDEQINQLFNNAFYFCINEHLNGKLKGETIYPGSGNVPQYSASYTYSNTQQGSVLYPKCIATFLPNLFWRKVNFHFGFFRKFVTWTYLTSKSETFYNSSGSVTNSNTTTYTYNESNYQPATKTVSNGHQSEKTRYWYPLDDGNPSSGLSFLKDRNYLSEVTAVYNYRNNVFIGGKKYNYTLNGGIPVVSRCYSILPGFTDVLELNVTDYDGYGNIQQYQKKNGTPVTIIWSYRHQLPIMEIVGKTYDDLRPVFNVISLLENAPTPSESTIKELHKNISRFPDAHVTAYLYSPWHTVSRVIMPNGQELSYDYDGEGRLIRSSDLIGTLQEYQYKYKNQ